MEIKQVYKRIVILTTICTLIVVAGFLARENTKAFEKTIITQTQGNLLTIARTEAQHINRRIIDTQDELRVLAENPKVKEAIINGWMDEEEPSVDGYAPEKLVQEHLMKSVDAIYRLDNKGIVQSIFPWEKGKAGDDYSQKDGVRNVLKNHRPYMSELFKSGSSDYSFSICHPVFKGNKFIGILRALIKMETIHNCLEDSNIEQRGYAQIIDSDGIMISHPKSEHINKDVIRVRKEACPNHDWSDMEEIVRRMTNGEQGVGIYHSAWWSDEEPRIVKKITAFVPIKMTNNLWSLGTVINYDEVSAPVHAHTRKTVVESVLVMLVFFISGGWFYKIQKEKEKLANEARSAEKLRMLNEQLKIAIYKAEMANAFKSQFLANMSHEIRTPMNGIIGFSDLLADEELTDEQREYVDIIRSSGGSLLRLINDILDLSKIEADKIDVEIIDCSLKEILTSIEPLMKAQASGKGIEVQVVTADALPAQIRTDPARLNQCLINLTNNAIKFTEQGHVYVNVSLQENDGKPFIRFDVEDTGIGISPENQESIFEPFVQADGSTTRKFGGTGLGLTITKRLAELMGGKLSRTSEVGKGSVFSLVIPAGVDIAKQPLLGRSNSANQPDNAQDINDCKFSGSILVAEDDPHNQMFITKLLEKMGLKVTIAEDGKIAVQKAQAQPYDMVFMDMQMPKMSGYEATKKLRDDGVSTPIIALTANAMKSDRDKCIEAGCDDYISKPIDKDKLMEVINKYLPVKVEV